MRIHSPWLWWLNMVSILALLTLSNDVRGEYRTALLIGNSNYEKAKLTTPPADVKAMAKVLQHRGFTVTVHENLTGKEMKATIEQFAESAPVTGTALVYFSGYALRGVQGDRTDNHFIPIGAKVKNAWEVARTRIGVKWVANYLNENSGNRVTIVLVDGCYQHPGQEAKTEPGLLKLDDLPAETVLAYAAPLGETVLPRESEVAEFTAKLTEALSEKNHSLIHCIEECAGYFQSSLTDPDLFAKSASQAMTSPEQFPIGRKAGDEWVNRYGMVFCWCPPGTYTMGSPTDFAGRYKDEGPVKVTLEHGFWISKYELTRQTTKVVYGRTPYLSRGTHINQPVNGFTPRDCEKSFLKPLNEKEREAGSLPMDWEYTLPSEAQWEYAARAGTNTPFYFGSDKGQLFKHANFADKTLYLSESGLRVYAHQQLDDGFEEMCQVGMYQPNPWGLHDVYGNVWEWCRDDYTEKLPGRNNPVVFNKGNRIKQVARGGSWMSPAKYCRSAFRHRFTPDGRNISKTVVGFRIIIQKKEK